MKSKDLFSGHAADYSAFRPDYPAELFEFIFSQINGFDSAWDSGTGNGQAAKILAKKFRSVYATDISDKQLANATELNENIQYSISPAEQTPFKENQFDLITVAQAIHWFKFDEFYKEVRRVAKSNSIITAWGYGVLNINPDFDIALRMFYKSIVGPYWDPERRHIDERYESIPFPFKEIKTPEFHFTKKWTLAQLEGYLSTWSAVQKFIKVNSYNPVTEFIQSVRTLLPNDPIGIHFPLFMRMGRIQ